MCLRDVFLLRSSAVTTYEPRVKAKTDIFIEQLRKSEGKPMDITAWSMFYGFDGKSNNFKVLSQNRR